MDLASIAPPAVDTYTVGGQTFTQRGITARECQRLCVRFPEFLEEVSRGLSIDACNALLAASAGKIDDAETEAFFDGLTVGRHIILGNAAIRRSFGPFDDVPAAASPPSSSLNGIESLDATGQDSPQEDT